MSFSDGEIEAVDGLGLLNMHLEREISQTYIYL